MAPRAGFLQPFSTSADGLRSDQGSGGGNFKEHLSGFCFLADETKLVIIQFKM